MLTKVIKNSPANEFTDEYKNYLDRTMTKIYSVIIDEANTNPETAVTYADDAIGMIPAGSGECKDEANLAWDKTPIFKNIKPCLLKNGVVQYYLNPDDYDLKAEGGASNLTGADGDVMIEIPKMGYRIQKLDGMKIKVSVTEEKNNPDFCYLPFSRDAIGDSHHIYIGAYLGYNNGGKLTSRSNISPSVDIQYQQFRQYCQANGAGYEMYSFYPHVLLQCLFLIRFKNRDSQTALGQGYTSSDNSDKTNTGGTNKKGMNFGYSGTNDRKQQIKFCGIEDWWGNLWCFMDGLYKNSSQFIGAWHDYGNNWNAKDKIIIGNMPSGNSYTKYTIGKSESGFMPSDANGSNSTAYADYFYQSNSNRIAYVGGGWSGGLTAGAFCYYVYLGPSYSDSYSGSRLMYKDNK